jgi:hypothetical protein
MFAPFKGKNFITDLVVELSGLEFVKFADFKSRIFIANVSRAAYFM